MMTYFFTKQYHYW